ncbi:MAG: hypothetical protein AMXMBFR23_01020 [Chloroflexota bacterium]
MPEVTPEQFDAILDLLDELPPRISPLSLAFNGVPAPGSPGDQELKLTRHVAEPFSISLQAIVFAGDHAFALRRLLTSPVMTFAPWTVTRGVIEACSQRLWFLDPALTVSGRVARGLNARLTSINDGDKFVRGSTRTEAKAESERLQHRREHLTEVAAAEGIEVISARGRVIGFGERVPQISQVVAAAGYASPYRLFSAISHQRTWATIGTGFTVVDDEADHGMGIKRLEQRMTPEIATYLTTTSLQAIVAAMYRLVVYAGWEPSLFAADLDAILDRTILNPRLRPWR